MRKKLPSNEKRNKQIGIKVLTETREKLEYIAWREDLTLSTLINKIIITYIGNYLEIAKIDWENLPPEEKRKGVKG